MQFQIIIYTKNSITINEYCNEINLRRAECETTLCNTLYYSTYCMILTIWELFSPRNIRNAWLRLKKDVTFTRCILTSHLIGLQRTLFGFTSISSTLKYSVWNSRRGNRSKSDMLQFLRISQIISSNFICEYRLTPYLAKFARYIRDIYCCKS